jgi:hypothetical protein
MPQYLIPKKGAPTFGIGICDRCNTKHFLPDMKSDPNIPGIRVCELCVDLKDPWTYAALPNENITLEYPRPDIALRIPDEPEFELWLWGDGKEILWGDGEPMAF